MVETLRVEKFIQTSASEIFLPLIFLPKQTQPDHDQRRSFLTTSSAAVMTDATHAFAANGSSVIKIALIGC
jgi:hypothetical protein